jgi:hypothetical protein
VEGKGREGEGEGKGKGRGREGEGKGKGKRRERKIWWSFGSPFAIWKISAQALVENRYTSMTRTRRKRSQVIWHIIRHLFILKKREKREGKKGEGKKGEQTIRKKKKKKES